MSQVYVCKARSRMKAQSTARGTVNYGEAYLGYRGPRPILFTTTAVCSGVFAVVGYVKGGLPGAVIGGVGGAIIGTIIGSLLEMLVDSISRQTQTTY